MYKKRRRLSQILVADFNFFLKCMTSFRNADFIFKKSLQNTKKGVGNSRVDLRTSHVKN